MIQPNTRPQVLQRSRRPGRPQPSILTPQCAGRRVLHLRSRVGDDLGGEGRRGGVASSSEAIIASNYCDTALSWVGFA